MGLISQGSDHMVLCRGSCFSVLVRCFKRLSLNSEDSGSPSFPVTENWLSKETCG